MKILYWATATIFGNTINFNVVGEGSIQEECEENGKQNALLVNPLCRQIVLQQLETIA